MTCLMATWLPGPIALNAATLFWDSDYNGTNGISGAIGGAGIWNTTNLAFDPDSFGASAFNNTNGNNALWVNGNNDTAVFAGTAGQITLGAPITVGGLQFNTTAYILGVAANTNAITFGANSNIVLNNVAAATINGSLAGSGNVTLTGGVFGGATAGTLNLSGTGTSLTGYTGTTTINNGMTMSLSQNSQALASTTGLTLNGGGITLTNTTTAEGSLDRVASSAITSNGGTITYANTSGNTLVYAETVGSVGLTSGQLNVVENTNMAGTTNTQTLTLGGLTRTGATNTSVVTFSAATTAPNATTNIIAVTSAGTTSANTIIGPWATVGTTAALQTDYAVYSANNVVAANIAATTNASWTTAANSYTLGVADALLATRTINSLRYTGGALTLGLGASTFSLETYGILNGGSGLLTITNTGTGAVRTPTGGGNLFITTGNNAITFASGAITDNSGNVTLVKSGTGGTLTLTAANSYSGGTVINAGTISIPANASLGNVAGGLTFNSSGGLTFSATTTLGTSGTPTNRAIALNNGAIAAITNGAFSSSVLGNISGTGGVNYTAGTLLTIGQSGSTSTYTGPTILTSGALKSGVADAYGSNSAVTITAGSIDITSFNTAIGSLSGAGSVTMGAATLTIGGNNESTSYTGVLGTASTAGVLTKTGTGVLTLTGTNIYTGATNLNGGFVNIATLSNVGAGTAITYGGGGIQWAAGSSVDLSARTLTFNTGGATFDTNNNQVVFASAVGNNGAGGMTKTGLGTLTVQAANTYTGVTTVNQGILNVQNATGLGTANNGSGLGTIVSSGATLQIQGVSVGAEALTLNGNGSVAIQNGALVNVSGSNSYAGTLTLGSSSTISVDGGSLNLSSTGNITGSGFTLTLGGAGSGTLAGAIQTGAGGLSKTGTGTWTLSSTTSNYTGPTSITDGTLSFVGGALGSTSGTTLGGGTLSLTSGSQNVGNLTLSAGASSTVTVGSAGSLTVGSTITRAANSGSTVLFDISAGGGAVVPSSASGTGTNNILGYAMVRDGTATGMAQISGGNIIRFDSTAATVLAANSNNATTDYTTLTNSGTLTWTNSGALANRSVNSLTIDATGNSGQITNMGAATNVLTLTSGALQFIGAGNGTLTGGQVGAANAEVIVHQNGAGEFTLASQISSGTGSYLQVGSGTVILSGINTYSGATRVNGGTLKAGVGFQAFGMNSAVTLANTAGVSLDLNGFNETIGSLSGGGASGGNVNLRAGTLTIGGITTVPAGLTLNTSSLTPSTLALGGSTTQATSTVFGGLISGTGGSIIKNGAGVLRLTNAGNSYTGQTIINAGTLVVTDAGALGNSTSMVTVNGLAGGGQTGFGAPSGMLTLGGGVTPITTSRNFSFAGRGQDVAGAAFLSIGNNVINGNVSIANTIEPRAAFAGGTTTFNGTVALAGTANYYYNYGLGNIIYNGVVTGGTGAGLLKAGGPAFTTTMLLNNVANTLTSDVRVDSGTIRVANGGALGIATSVNAMRGTGGIFEIRTDAPTSFSTRRVSEADLNNTTLTIFVDRAVSGSTLLNQTVAFSDLVLAGGTNNTSTLLVSGRNGYGVSFTGLAGIIGGGGTFNPTFTNSSSGTLNLNASIWNTADTTARPMTINGNAETVLTGNILASGALHSFTKSGSGTVTIGGTASTFTGDTTLSAGTANIGTVGAFNATSVGRVVLGGGTLNYTGAGETWANKILLLNATNGILTSNGTGAVVIQQNVGNNGTGVKSLVLGGASTATNDLQGIVVNTTAGAGVTKFDTGTWQISSPGTTSATIGTANASFGITAVGTASQTITTTSTAGLVVGQTVSGGGVPFGTVISQIISGTQFQISQQSAVNVATTLNIGTVTGATASINTSGASAGTTTAPTLTFASTANLVVGQQVTHAALTGNWYISAITSGTVVTLSSTTGNTLTVGGIASGQAIVPVASPNFAGPLTITGGTVQLKQNSGNAVLSGLSNVVFAADTIRSNGFAGGTLNYLPSAGGSQTAGILSITAGAGTVQITGTSGTNTLTFGSITAPSLGTGLNFVTSGAGTNTIVLAAPPAVGLLNAHAYYNGADFAYNPTTGSSSTLRAPVYGTDAGFLAVNTLTTGNNLAINTSASTGAITATSLKISGNSTLTLTGILTVGGASGGGVLVDGATTGAVITGASGITTNSAGDLAFRVNGASDILTLSAPMLATTTGGFTKNGAGTLVLNAVNLETAAGTININEGTLKLSGATTTLGATNMNLTLRQGTIFDVNGVNVSATPVVSGTATLPLNALNGAGTVTNGAASGTATIAIGSGNTAGIFSGVIQDGASAAISLTKLGTATQTLTGLNTFTGVLTFTGTSTSTIAATTLADIGVASSIGRGGLGGGTGASTAQNQGSIVFASGANTIQYTGASANVYQTTQTPSISINRLFTITGGATGTLDSSGQYGNNTAAASTANMATLIFNNTNAIAYTGSGTATLGLTGTSTGDNEFRPLLNNVNFALTKSGTGLWILNPSSLTPNTYGGATTITAGNLRAQDGVGLSSSSNLVLNGGTLESSGTFTRAVGTGSGQVQWGANTAGGFAASTAALTVNLGGAAATLTWGSGSIGNGTGALILNSTTALFDVNFVNPINLNAGNRTITVNDNTTTGMDFATISGVISGAVGSQLTLNGAGVTFLTGANTYAGPTNITGTGPVEVTSIGASGATSSNFGTNVGGGPLNLGSSTNAPYLLYYGNGETTTRTINLSGGAANPTIDASGAGALILNNVVNTGVGAKTLTLRGFSTDLNEITSQLSDAGGTALGVTKTDSGTWILSGANTYTGATAINGGFLGIGGATIGTAGTATSTSAITISNGGIFATNPGGLIINNATTLTIANNATATFTGSNAITINGTISRASGANDITINNTMASGSVLTFAGNFINLETGTTRNLNIIGTGATVWSGVIQNSGGAALTNIIYNSFGGVGSLTLSNTNTYTGNTTITAGLVTISNGAGLGNTSTGNVTVSSGGALELQNNITTPAKAITISGVGTAVAQAGALRNLSGSNVLAGTVTLGAAAIIQSDAGTLTLNTAATSIAAVTFGLTVQGAGNVLVSNAITGTTATVTKFGSGTLTVAGANTYTGLNSALGGIFAVTGSATDVIANTSGLVVGGGGTFQYNGASTGSTETLGALTLNNANSGFGSIQSVYGTSGNTALTFSSVTARNSGAGVNYLVTGGLNGSTNMIVLNGQTTNSFINAGSFFGGSSYAFNDTAGFVRGMVYGTDSQTSAANALTPGTHSQITSNQSVGSSLSIRTLNISGTADLTMGTGTSLMLVDGGILETGGGSSTISGGTAINALLTPDLTVRTDAVSDNLTISTSIAALGLTKNGNGTLTLSAANQIQGTVRSQQGALIIGNSAALQRSTLDMNVVDSGSVTFGSFASLALGGLQGARSLSTGSANLTIGANGATTTYSGALTGSGTITKSGGGTLILSGNNIGYTGGGSTVNTGTLQLGNANAFGTAPGKTMTLFTSSQLNLFIDVPLPSTYDVMVRGNSTISVDRSTAAGSNNVNFIGSLGLNNSTLTVASANGYGLQVTGATTLFGAISSISTAFNPLQQGSAGIQATINNAASLAAFTGAIGGNGALNKLGAGTVTLQAANTYTGGTNILAGSLLLNTNAATLGAPTTTTTTTAVSTASTALVVTSTATVNGQLVTGTGIPVGTRIVSGGGTTSLVLSQAVTVGIGDTVVFRAGNVIVNPGTTLGIVSNANVAGANLYLPTSLSATGGSAAILRANANADLSGGTLNAAVVGAYGASFQLDTGTPGVQSAAGSGAVFNPVNGDYAFATIYSQNINLNNFGGTAAGTGRIMLGSTAANTTMSGIVSNTAGGSTDDIRFGGTGILTLSATNALGTTAQTVQIGSPIGNAQPLTAGAGTTAFSGANNTNYTGTMIVNKGATMQAPALFGTNVFGTGALTVLGGSVNVLNNATATNYTGGPQIGNSAINLYANAGVVSGAGALFTLDNSAVTLAGGTTNLRLVGTTPINAWGGSTFSIIGSNTAATTTSQSTGAYNFQGGNVINLTSNATAASNSDTVLTIANLVRNGNGTMTFTRAGTTQPASFGSITANSNSRLMLTQINSTSTSTISNVVTNDMLAPWLVDQTANSFLTYSVANGITTLGTTYGSAGNFDVNGNSAAAIQGATTSQKVDVTVGSALIADASVYSMRIGNVALTQTGGPFTVTIGAGASASDGAGLIMTGAQTHTPNFNFGTGGNREAVIYNSAAVTLSGNIAASGLTKFGTANLTLSGVNSGLTGTLTVNQGGLLGTTTGYNFRPITLAGGGQLDLNSTVNGIYLNDVTVTGESILSAGGNTPRINSLTMAARLGTATAPVSLMVNSGTVVGNYGSTYVSGSGTSVTGGGLVLNAPTNWISGTAASSGTAGANTNILGIVSGGASNTLYKWGNAPLSFSNSANTYSGGTVINGAGGDSRNAVRSLVGAANATPFGTGSITVNPGGVLGLAAPSNTWNGTTGNALILNSDLSGLAVVSLSYGGSAALPSFASTTLNNSNLGGPFSGVLAVEAVGFSSAVNLNTLWGGTAFLGGGSTGGTATGNITGALTPSTFGKLVADLNGGAPVAGNNVYRIGAGGGTTMNFMGAANQFTGATDIQIGAISNVTAGASVALASGGATTAIYNSNNISGNVYLNTGATLIAGRNDALGTAKIVFNGGTIQADAGTGLPFFNTTRTLSNSIGFTGDAIFAGGTDLTLTSGMGLADNQSGVTRTFTVSNTTGLVTLSGIISNGAGTASDNNLTKSGAGALVLGSANTYTGLTNINQGTLVVTSDANLGASTRAVTLGGGSLGAWTTSYTTSRDYILTAASTFDVGPGVTLTQAAINATVATGNISGAFALTKAGLGTLVLNGSNTMSGVTVNNGILSVSDGSNLGDVNVASAITLNGGALRASGTFATNRALTATSGAVDVVSGASLTLTGVISGAAFIKTGAGTFVNNTGTNTATGITVENGTLLFNGTNTPFGAAATLNFNGGTYQQTNTTANQAFVTSATISYGGGGHLGLQSGTGFSSQLQSANITRSVAGTLIIEPGTSALAVAGNTNNVRLIPTTLINTVAVASANINGMLPASIVTQVSGIGAFSTYAGATGINTFSAFSSTFAAGNLGATTNTSTVDVTTAAITTFTSPTQSVYALRTNQNISGGTLRISSVNGLTATNQGGLIINGSRTIGASLIFDPTAASGGSAASGEGLVYVNPGSSAIISGNVHATSFVKFGGGNLQLSGASTGILNTLAVHEGTLTLGGGLTFDKMQTDLVLTNTGTLDLGGQRLTFASLSNGAAVTGTIAGGLISNTSASAASLVVGGTNTTLTTFAGQITETSGAITLVKSGTGTLILAPFNIAAPDAGNNTFTGGTIVNQGTLTVQDPRALGSGTLTIQNGATVNFNSNGPGINSTIITGTPGGSGLNVVNNGIATLSTDRLATVSGNVMQFNNLALNEGILTLTGANSYRIRFNGTTTIAGGGAVRAPLPLPPPPPRPPPRPPPSLKQRKTVLSVTNERPLTASFGGLDSSILSKGVYIYI